MKDFAKNRLMPFLLVAITALCALFGVILTTPNTVKADASTTPYDKELGFEVLESENLFGKYVAVFSSGGDASDYSTVTVGNGDWEFFVNDEGLPSINVFSSEGGSDITDSRVVFEIEYLTDQETYMVVFDFTKEYTFSVDCGNGPVEITLNEETLIVNEVSTNAISAPLSFYPTATYSIKTPEDGDSLAGKYLIVPYLETGEGYYWSIGLKDYSIYFDDMDAGIYFTIVDENGDPQIQEDIVLKWGGGWVYSLYAEYIATEYFMLRIPETYSLTEEGITYESTLIFDNVEVSGFENNFRVFEFIEDDTPTETPDTPNEPTDGEQPKDDNGKASFLDDVANWFDKAGETVSNWLGERNIEISGRGVLVAGVVLAVVISLFRRGRRRK